VLKPGGRLLIGWNTERVADPTELDAARSAFEADDLLQEGLLGQGGRAAVPEAGYVYAFLRRKGGAASGPESAG